MESLPWPDLAHPPLPLGRFGDWEIVEHPIRRIRGYFRGVQEIDHTNITLKRDGVTWMSLAPMELESQQHHAAFAHGHTVIGGGGLGIVLYNVLVKQDVTRVTLVERDPDVLRLLRYFWGHSEWPGLDKLNVVEGDLLEPHDLGPAIDFLYLDIWPTLGSHQAIADSQRVQAYAGASTVGWWGQEINFYRWARENGYSRAPGEDAYDAWTGAIDLPILRVKDHWVWATRATKNFLRQWPPPE